MQVCADLEAGCESAIQAMDSVLKYESTDAVLLIDAENVLNFLNRETFIHNVKITFPAIATFVSNFYCSSSSLFFNRGCEIKSAEFTTQSDLIAMIICEVATIPLILMIIEKIHGQPDNNAKLEACADDFIVAGTLTELKPLWNILCELGPKFGYHLQASKSWVIVLRK